VNSCGFQILEHTADFGIRAWGKTWKDLFEQSAMGMLSQIIDPARVKPLRTKTVTFRGENPEEILLKGLKEILFHIEKDGMIFSSVRLIPDVPSRSGQGRKRAKIILRGERIDPQRHNICMEIKGVTRHGFFVEHKKACWETRILFDV
jgi:SHS2 domain-containing protein